MSTTILSQSKAKQELNARQILARASYAWLLKRMRNPNTDARTKDKIALSVVHSDITKPIGNSQTNLAIVYVSNNYLAENNPQQVFPAFMPAEDQRIEGEV